MSVLFEGFTIGSMHLKNRFVRSATFETLGDYKGHPLPELTQVYERLADGDVGLIITGYMYVAPDEQPNPRMVGLCDDAVMPALKFLTNAVHDHGSCIVAQLVYGGSATRLDPPSPHIIGPSAIENPSTGITPVEATQEDINYLIDCFASAAGRAKDAGYDGAEMHVAHGYVLSQFLNPLLNHRSDAYGGSIENRARISCEIIDAARQVVGPDFPLLVKLNSSDGIAGGLTEDDSLKAAQLFVQHGIDAVEVSGTWQPLAIEDFENEPFFEEYACRLVPMIDVPVILTGGNRRIDVMERLVNENGIAAFGLSRPLLCEPDLINTWEADPSAEVKCISCSTCLTSPDRQCIFHDKTRGF